MIKAILFDMGGVIVNLDRPRCIESFKRMCGLDSIDSFLNIYHPQGTFQDMEGGAIGEQEFYRRILAECRPGTTVQQVRNAFWSLIGDIEPYKADFIKELSAKYDVYMLSNNNPLIVRRIRGLFRRAGLPMDTFKGLFFSYKMKMLKPNPEIYREAVRQTGLKASECLFIDDSDINVKAAEAVGMKGLHYIQGTDLKAAITKTLE